MSRVIHDQAVGRYQASEGDVISRPRVRSAETGVVFAHGAGWTGTTAFFDMAGDQYDLLRAVSGERALVSTDLGGTQTWGNDTARTRMGTARTYLGTATGATVAPVFVIAVSMGSLAALRYLLANPTLVKGIVLCIPVVSLDDLYQRDVNGSRAAIETAWDVTHPDALPAGSDPYTLLEDIAETEVPIGIWYGGGDTIAPPEFVEDLAEATGAVLHLTGEEDDHGDVIPKIDSDEVIALLEGWDA